MAGTIKPHSSAGEENLPGLDSRPNIPAPVARAPAAETATGRNHELGLGRRHTHGSPPRARSRWLRTGSGGMFGGCLFLQGGRATRPKSTIPAGVFDRFSKAAGHRPGWAVSR